MTKNVTVHGVAVAAALVCLAPACLLDGEPDAATRHEWRQIRDQWRRMSQLGNGFVVWESNRNRRWRIWRRNLDGSGLRQISPEETDCDHFCPHLSPDGTRLVYLSFPAGFNTYNRPPPQGGSLYLISSAGGQPTSLAPHAHGYFGDRAAVWIDNDRLIYIDGDGASRELDVRSGKESRLAHRGTAEGGYLINGQKTHATTGHSTFSTFDAAQSLITPQDGAWGCQPYFTHDGRWGFYMGGPGGPINRIDLRSRQVSPILNHSDPRMPPGRRYLYFPMVSRDSRFLTFAASRVEHDHFKSDYDVFVARLNPQSLEIIDQPVRYTFDESTDRYPDVYAADLALGQITGEAPHTIEVTIPDSSGDWSWDFGDGKTAHARTAKHHYERPGEYRLTARRDDRTLEGLVTITAAAPPRPLAVWVAKPAEIVVSFDEPIDISGVSAHLDSDLEIIQTSIGDSPRELIVQLNTGLAADDCLRLSGIRDRAQRPNAMPASSLTVSVVAWPAEADGLQYVFETADRPNLVIAADGNQRRFTLAAHGRARFDHHQSLVVTGGAFTVDGAEQSLLEACQKTGELTIEGVILPDHLGQKGPARIVTFSSGVIERNFTLGQQADRLIFLLRTSNSGVSPSELSLCRLSADRRQHVAVTYRSGELVCYVDGRELYRSKDVHGDFSVWGPHHLLFGDEWGGKRGWAGTLEGVAIFSRALTAAEISRDALQYLSQIQARRKVPRVGIEAELIARSKLPTLDEIKPYRSALAVYKYRVIGEVPAALEGAREVLVAHWSLLDGQEEMIAQLQPGEKTWLELEPLESHPHLRRYVCNDEFDSDDDLVRRRYYDARP